MVQSYGVLTLFNTNKETDENGLCRLVWKCSYYTEMDTNIDPFRVLFQFISNCLCISLFCVGQCECIVTVDLNTVDVTKCTGH